MIRVHALRGHDATIEHDAAHGTPITIRVTCVFEILVTGVRMRTATDANPVLIDELRQMATGRFGDMVKAVVDLRRGIVLLDADMHADQEAELLADGSAQQDLWGINLYPDLPDSDWLEFDSMINLRPSFGNRSRGVDDPAIRERILDLVERVVRRR